VIPFGIPVSERHHLELGTTQSAYSSEPSARTAGLSKSGIAEGGERELKGYHGWEE